MAQTDYYAVEWLHQRVPSGFWNDRRNHLRYVEWLAKKLGIAKLDDWYDVTTNDFRVNRGVTILIRYQWSISKLLRALYPAHNWKEWLFYQTPKGFWDDRAGQSNYLKWLADEFRITQLDDWYTVTTVDVIAKRGDSFLHRFDGSLVTALKSHFPEHNWLEWKFHVAPHRFWEAKKNCERYMRWLGRQLGYHKWEDWYGVRHSDFEGNYGGGILGMHDGKPMRVVQAVFSHREWVEWLFAHVPAGFWKKKANRLRYLKWLGQRLGFEGPNDWTQLVVTDLKRNNGSGLLAYYGGSPKPARREGLKLFDQRNTAK